MDPLSIVAGVAGLMRLTIEVSHRITTFYQAAKHASKSVQDIQEELSLMQTVLEQLKSLLQSGDLETNSIAQTSVLTAAIRSCSQSIESIAAKLPKSKPDALSRAKDALRWPFNEKEVLKFLETLRRHMSTFQFALTIEGW